MNFKQARAGDPVVYFFFPLYKEENLGLPVSINDCWEWQLKGVASQGACWGRRDHWVLQTYLYLKEAGFPCALIHKIPEEGIVFCVSDLLPYNLKPNKKLFFVYLVVDSSPDSFRYANMRIVHNKKNENRYDSFYMPPWSQIALIPRSQKRGTTFCNVAYFGYSWWLTKELQSPAFRASVQDLGLNFTLQPERGWNDFSNVDCILAVRSFDPDVQHLSKPPLKLINAWQAGVPAVLGSETAYQTVGKQNVDFIEVRSVADVLGSLKKLRDDVVFRNMIVQNGLKKGFEYSYEKNVERWKNLIEVEIVPKYIDWRSRATVRWIFFLRMALEDIVYFAPRLLKQWLKKCIRVVWREM